MGSGRLRMLSVLSSVLVIYILCLGKFIELHTRTCSPFSRHILIEFIWKCSGGPTRGKLGLTLEAIKIKREGALATMKWSVLHSRCHGLVGWLWVRDLISLIYSLRLLTPSPHQTQLLSSPSPFPPPLKETSPPHHVFLCLFPFGATTFQILARKARRGGALAPPLCVPQPSFWDVQGEYEIFKSSNWNPVSSTRFSSLRTSVSVCWCHLGTPAFQTIDWTFLSIQHF